MSYIFNLKDRERCINMHDFMISPPKGHSFYGGISHDLGNSCLRTGNNSNNNMRLGLRLISVGMG